MRKLARYTFLFVLVSFLYLGWVMTYRYLQNRRSEPAAPKPLPAAYSNTGTAVKITQFYAVPGTVVEGDRAILCYGVANAKVVRLDPPVEEVWPSINRCLEVAPEKDTQYTLTAEGPGGPPVKESFLIQVKPDPYRLPQVTYFLARRKQPVQNAVGYAKAKWVHSLCFHTENSVRVTVDPPVVPPSGAIEGCFYVAPEATTTYTLTAADRKGRTAQKKLTVKVD